MSVDREQSRRFWNAQVEDGRYETEFGPGTLIRNRRLATARKATEERNLERLVSFAPDQTVIDLGCGTGRWALYFAPRVARVVGTDLSEGMIRRARELVASANVTNVELELKDATDFSGLPRADLIHAGGVLQCLSDEDVVKVGREARAHLAPRGILLSRDSVGDRRVELSGRYPVVYRTEKEYIELMRTAGLELASSSRACVIPEILPKLMAVVSIRDRNLERWIELDGRLMRAWPVPAAVRLYHRITGRGSGLVLEHRFAVWRPMGS